MASNTIVNGAPMTILRGIQDLSTRTLPIEAEVIPTHLPKVYIYAQKGPTSPQLVVGNARNQMYGDDTFDLRKKYANHATVLSNTVNAQGNSQMIERIVPDDAGPRSNFCLYLDLVQADILQYQRNTDGSIKVDGEGAPMPVAGNPVLPGYRGKWVIETISTVPGELTFGSLTQKAGNQTAGVNTSIRYPILQFWASSYGEVFNNSGLRISAPTALSATPVNSRGLTAMKAYPFRVSAIRRATATATPTTVQTEAGEPYFDFVLAPNMINPLTDSRMSLGDIFLDKFQNLSDPRFPMKFGDFGGMHVYQNNIDQIVYNIYDAEQGNQGTHADINPLTPNTIDTEMYLINMFTAQSSFGAPYFTYEINTTDADAVRLTENTNLFAQSGSDGTMNDTAFSDVVAVRLAEYANPNSSLMDTAVNVESIFYDSGFPLTTKYAACKFISERKDTAVVLSTYVVNGSELSASEESSIAIALKTHLQMYPESDYYGTPIVRGVILGRYGKLLNSQYTGKLPLTIELASKAASFMGSGDGRWKPKNIFDKAPNSEITMFKDINITFTPAQVRNNDWAIGLNWVQSFTRKTVYFPALKTVYDNDTSVLTSFFTMMAAVELTKVGERVHRLFSGSVSLTDAELIKKVNEAVEERTIGRFADLYKVVPAAYKTAADTARGYSITLPIKLYANNQMSVTTLHVDAYRMSDYAA